MAGRGLDDGGADEQPLVVGHQEHGLDVALQAAVHEGQLEFVFEVRDGAQTAQDGTGPALGRVFHGQAGEGLHQDAVVVAHGLAGHGHAFFLGEEGELGRIVGHGHHDLVEDGQAAADEGQMPVGQGIEGAGIECQFHASVHISMRV